VYHVTTAVGTIGTQQCEPVTNGSQETFLAIEEPARELNLAIDCEMNASGSEETASPENVLKKNFLRKRKLSESSTESSVKRFKINEDSGENPSGSLWYIEEFEDQQELQDAFQNQMLAIQIKDGSESDMEDLKDQTRAVIEKMVRQGKMFTNGGKFKMILVNELLPHRTQIMTFFQI